MRESQVGLFDRPELRERETLAPYERPSAKAHDRRTTGEERRRRYLADASLDAGNARLGGQVPCVHLVVEELLQLGLGEPRRDVANVELPVHLRVRIAGGRGGCGAPLGETGGAGLAEQVWLVLGHVLTVRDELRRKWAPCSAAAHAERGGGYARTSVIGPLYLAGRLTSRTEPWKSAPLRFMARLVSSIDRNSENANFPLTRHCITELPGICNDSGRAVTATRIARGQQGGAHRVELCLHDALSKEFLQLELHDASRQVADVELALGLCLRVHHLHEPRGREHGRVSRRGCAAGQPS